MHLSKLVAILGGTLLLSACAGSQATTRHQPRGFWQPNRSDRQGREQGRWRTYYDSADAQPFTAGRYRHGRRAPFATTRPRASSTTRSVTATRAFAKSRTGTRAGRWRDEAPLNG